MTRGFSDDFGHYLPPSVTDIEAALTTGIVVPDASVLLSSYLYDPVPRDELICVLERLAERIFIPHQVALEFHRKRVEVICERVRLIELARQALPPSAAAAEDLQAEDGTVDLFGPDHVLTRLRQVLDGKVGQPLRDEEHWQAEAGRRINEEIPPGYKNADKQYPYGDYFVWRQALLEASMRNAKHLVFVTTRCTEDWYSVIKDRAVVARPELAAEAWAEARTRLVLLNITQFLDCAKSCLKIQGSTETIRQGKTLPFRGTAEDGPPEPSISYAGRTYAFQRVAANHDKVPAGQRCTDFMSTIEGRPQASGAWGRATGLPGANGGDHPPAGAAFSDGGASPGRAGESAGTRVIRKRGPGRRPRAGLAETVGRPLLQLLRQRRDLLGR